MPRVGAQRPQHPLAQHRERGDDQERQQRSLRRSGRANSRLAPAASSTSTGVSRKPCQPHGRCRASAAQQQRAARVLRAARRSDRSNATSVNSVPARPAPAARPPGAACSLSHGSPSAATVKGSHQPCSRPDGARGEPRNHDQHGKQHGIAERRGECTASGRTDWKCWPTGRTSSSRTGSRPAGHAVHRRHARGGGLERADQRRGEHRQQRAVIAQRTGRTGGRSEATISAATPSVKFAVTAAAM